MTIPPCANVLCPVSIGYRANGKPRLQFNGEAITVQAADDILAKWGSHYDIALSAANGSTTYLQAPGIAAEARSAPAVAVIELGTNDARCPIAPNRYLCGLGTAGYVAHDVTGRLQLFSEEFPPSTCLVFVVPDDHNPSYGSAQAEMIDAYERAHFAHLADWQAAYHPGYFDTPNQPHPNEGGRQALLSLIDRAMTGCGR